MKCVLHVITRNTMNAPYILTTVITKPNLGPGPLGTAFLSVGMVATLETVRPSVKSKEHGAVDTTQSPAHRTAPHRLDVLERFMASWAFRIGRTFGFRLRGPTKHHKLVFLVNVVKGFTVDTRGDILQVGDDCKER